MTAALIEQLRAEQALLSGRRDDGGRRGNDRARAEALRLEEQLLESVHAFADQDRWRPIEEALSRANQALRGFEQTSDYSSAIDFDSDNCLLDCDQHVSRDLLVKPKDVANPAAFQRLIDEAADLQRQLQRRPDNGGPFIVDSLARGIKQLERAEASIKDSCLSAAPFAKPMEDVLAALRDLTQLPRLETNESLVELDERLRRLLFDVEAAQKEQAHLFAEGEIKDAEAKYYEVLQLQEVASQIITTKFTALDAYTQNVIETLLRDASLLQTRTEGACNAMLEDGTQLKKRCMADLASLNTSVNSVNQEHEDYIDRYQQEMERSNVYLKDTQKKQEAAWAKICQLERELGKLAKERHDEIQTRISNFETAEKHKVSYSNFSSFTKRHREALQATIKNCEMQEYLAQLARDFVRGRCETLVLCGNDRKNQLEDYRVKFHEEYLANFRNMYLTNGDLVYKKQRTAEQLEAQIQTKEARFQLCMETWDPEAKVYSQQKKELMKVREEISEQITKLESNQQLYLEWFGPTERYLQLTDRPFVHPKQELEVKNEQRAGKLIEYKALMEAAEDDESDDAEEDPPYTTPVAAITDRPHYADPRPPPGPPQYSTPARGFAPRPPMSAMSGRSVAGSRFPSLYRDVSPETVH